MLYVNSPTIAEPVLAVAMLVFSTEMSPFTLGALKELTHSETTGVQLHGALMHSQWMLKSMSS